jgi:hypothetical protein
VRSLAEYWYGASIISESLGGTAVSYEKVRRLGSGEEWIMWGLEKEGATAMLFNGGRSYEMEVLLNLDNLNCLNLKYSEVGILEDVRLDLVAFLCLTGDKKLMEVAEVMMDDGEDLLVMLDFVSEKVTMVCGDGSVEDSDVMEGELGEEGAASLYIELPGGKEFCIDVGVDSNEVQISLENVKDDGCEPWKMFFSRRVDAGAFADVKSPGAASDYLFGELMTMPVFA